MFNPLLLLERLNREKNMINKKLQAKKNTTQSKYHTVEIIIDPITSKELKLTWDYYHRYPTEKEREATRQYAYKLQREAREKINE